MAITRKFPKEDLKELVGWGDPEGYEEISSDILYTSRWSIHYDLVFKYEDKFYNTSFSRGATESQDERPFEYAENEIECVQVEPTEKTIIVYVPVKS